MNIFKYLIIIILLVSCKHESLESQYVLKYSKIDSLNSIAEVESFIHLKDTSLNKFHLKNASEFCSEKLKKFSKTEASKLFYKGDFDGNGLTDLFVVGSFLESKDLMYSFAFMNYGKDSINTIWTEETHSSFIPRIKKHGNQDVLEIFSDDFLQGLRKDTLVFKYGGFVNYNHKPGKYHIEKIELTTFDIRGELDVVMDKSLNVSLKKTRGHYDQTIVTNAKIKLSKEKHDQIFNLLEYMDFPKLKDSLRVGATDQPIANLKITYNNGKVKKIFDEGMTENFSLKNLYAKFESLRKFIK
jgi:hypothetical protein